MWIWRQEQGDLLDPSGKIVSVGYSGAVGFQSPLDQDIHNKGPIPQGHYTIEAPENTDTHGPYVLALTPGIDNDMFGRSGFLIHGDKIGAPGTASEGCIILPRDVREAIWQSGDHELEVIGGSESYMDEAEWG